MITKNIDFKASASGISGVIDDITDVGDAADKTGGKFKAAGKEAALFASAFAGAMAGAWKYMEKAVDKAEAFEAGLGRIQGALRLTTQQTAQLGAQLKMLGEGELASMPDYYDTIIDSAQSYLESGGDLINLQTDLANIYKFSAGTGQEYAATVAQNAAVTDAWNLKAGESATVLNTLRSVQLNTNKDLNSLSKGLEKGATLNTMYGLTIEQVASITAGWSSTGERASSMLTGVIYSMDELGARSFPELIEKLEQVNAGTLDLGGLSFSAQRYVAALAGQVTQISETYAELGEGVDYVSAGFDAFTHTTLAETTRAHNQLEAEMLAVGERMKHLKPQIELVKSEFQAALYSVAEFALKSPEYTAAIIAGVLAIRGAFVALKASNPFGLILAGVELLVGGLIALSDALVETTAERLADVRAVKQQTEEQLANVDATRAEVLARKRQAEATGESAERLAELGDQYERLTAQSRQMTAAISDMAVSEAQLVAQVEAENAANEITSTQYEALMGREIAAAQQSIQSGAERAKVMEDLADAQTNLVAAMDDESQLHEIARGLLVDTLGLDAARVDMALEEIDSREEVQALIKSINAGLDASKVAEEERAAATQRVLRYAYEEAGILGIIEDVQDGITDATAEEIEHAKNLAVIEHRKLITLQAQALAYLQMARAQGMSAGVISMMVAGLNKVTALLNQSTENLRLLGSIGGEESSGAGGTPSTAEATAAKAAEIAKGAARKSIEGIIDQWKLDWLDATDKGWAAFEKAGKSAVGEVAKKQEDDLDSTAQDAIYDLAGMFRGMFTDENWNIWDSFKQMGLKAIEDLAIYMAAKLVFGDLAAGLAPGGIGGLLSGLLGFAEGGRVTKPTLAMVGEGGAPEYIIPEPDMQAALTGGIPGVADLLASLGGNVQRGYAAPVGSNTTNVYNSYGLAVGSLDRLDAYATRAASRRARRAY